MVAASVDDAGFQDGVVQARGPYDLLGAPLGFVIAGSAVRPRAQEAHQRDLLYACPTRCIHDCLRAGNMDLGICLFSNLTIDPGAMGHRLAAFESAGQFFFIANRYGMELSSVNAPHPAIT